MFKNLIARFWKNGAKKISVKKISYGINTSEKSDHCRVEILKDGDISNLVFIVYFSL